MIYSLNKFSIRKINGYAIDKFVLVLLVSLVGASCSEDELTKGIEGQEPPISGQEQGITFRFGQPSTYGAAPTAEEKEIKRLDIYLFSEVGGTMILEQIFPDVPVGTNGTVQQSTITFLYSNPLTPRSFYFVANGGNSSSLNALELGTTTLATFMEATTDPISTISALSDNPLLKSSSVDLPTMPASGTVVTVNLKQRVARLDIANDPNSDVTITGILISGARSTARIFGTTEQSQEGTPILASTRIEYQVGKSVYLYPTFEEGETSIQLLVKKTGSDVESIWTINNKLKLAIGGLTTIKIPAASVSIDATSASSHSLSTTKEDYSGITWLTGTKYAVVSDKKDGFYIFDIAMDNQGRISSVSRSTFYGNTSVSRDCEGIVWHPTRNTLFISGEGDQRILEYTMEGTKTNTELAVPAIFAKAAGTGNYGFEALGYNRYTGLFWTTTESTLPRDGERASGNNIINNLLRIQSFDESLNPAGQYAYKMDMPKAAAGTPSNYAFGVPEITALNDGRLLVSEREFYATSMGFGSWVHNKIYLATPLAANDVSGVSDLRSVAESRFMSKKLLWEKETTLNGGTLANFEGMCLGQTLQGGKVSLLQINDSQSALSEYIQTLSLSQ